MEVLLLLDLWRYLIGSSGHPLEMLRTESRSSLALSYGGPAGLLSPRSDCVSEAAHISLKYRSRSGRSVLAASSKAFLTSVPKGKYGAVQTLQSTQRDTHGACR